MKRNKVRNMFDHLIKHDEGRKSLCLQLLSGSIISRNSTSSQETARKETKDHLTIREEEK